MILEAFFVDIYIGIRKPDLAGKPIQKPEKRVFSVRVQFAENIVHEDQRLVLSGDKKSSLREPQNQGSQPLLTLRTEAPQQ